LGSRKQQSKHAWHIEDRGRRRGRRGEKREKREIKKKLFESLGMYVCVIIVE
jgi:hypothetical protein